VVVLEKEPALANVTTAQVRPPPPSKAAGGSSADLSVLQAAGLVGQVRDNLERVKLAMWSVQTFSDLQQDSDYNPNWR